MAEVGEAGDRAARLGAVGDLALEVEPEVNRFGIPLRRDDREDEDDEHREDQIEPAEVGAEVLEERHVQLGRAHRAIREAGLSLIMNSYNEIDGIPAVADQWIRRGGTPAAPSHGRLRPHFMGLSGRADVLLLAGDLTNYGTAKQADALYPRVVSLVRKDNFVVVRADIYNRRNERQKVYDVRRLERPEGIWTVMDLEVVNERDRTRTELSVTSIRYNTGLTASNFSRRELEQGR